MNSINSFNSSSDNNKKAPHHHDEGLSCYYWSFGYYNPNP